MIKELLKFSTIALGGYVIRRLIYSCHFSEEKNLSIIHAKVIQ